MYIVSVAIGCNFCIFYGVSQASFCKMILIHYLFYIPTAQGNAQNKLYYLLIGSHAKHAAYSIIMLFSHFSCVHPVNRFNFLDKSVKISSFVEINNSSSMDDISTIVETHLPLHVPGFEGLVIPSRTCGHVLRSVGGNAALVQWEVSALLLTMLVIGLY